MKKWWRPEKPRSEIEKFFCELFYDTVVAMESYGIAVADMMPGASILIRQSGAKALVTVSWMGSWRDSLFVLLHELGHVASVRVLPKGLKICIRKRAASEKQANLTAYRVLTVAGFNNSILKSYVDLYNSLNKKPIRQGKRKPFVVE